jgi:hypothetical protein
MLLLRTAPGACPCKPCPFPHPPLEPAPAAPILTSSAPAPAQAPAQAPAPHVYPRMLPHMYIMPRAGTRCIPEMMSLHRDLRRARRTARKHNADAGCGEGGHWVGAGGGPGPVERQRRRRAGRWQGYTLTQTSFWSNDRRAISCSPAGRFTTTSVARQR